MNIWSYVRDILNAPSLKKKMLIALWLLALYRFLVFIPVPFVEIEILKWTTLQWWWIQSLAVLLWWTLERFSIIAVGLMPFINASIIMQLMAVVVPKLEEIQEQWEVWQKIIQQYTRYMTFPLAFLQAIGSIFVINSLLSSSVIDTSLPILLFAAFTMAVWSIMVMWIGELITEYAVGNGISLIIFASIISWMVGGLAWFFTGAADLIPSLLFILSIILVLIVLSIILIKCIKQIPIIYSRQWSAEQTSFLPVPLNPVWMIPIIFAISFVSFPYLFSQFVTRFGSSSIWATQAANWIEANINIYETSPHPIAITLFFILIVLFTFFYTLIVFNPEKIADNIQQRGWFIPWVRPWEETSRYLNKIFGHLSFWWWVWLALVWIYSYIITYIPFIASKIETLWAIPVVVSGSGIIIIVWVVQDILSKVNAELLMSKYETPDEAELTA